MVQHGSNQEKWQDEYILTGIKQKPKNINEYMKQKYGNGGNHYEPQETEKLLTHYEKFIPDLLSRISMQKISKAQVNLWQRSLADCMNTGML